jgi:hypothetical protein
MGPGLRRDDVAPSPKIQFLEEVIALVVDDEGREILDLDPPETKKIHNL